METREIIMKEGTKDKEGCDKDHNSNDSFWQWSIFLIMVMIE